MSSLDRISVNPCQVPQERQVAKITSHNQSGGITAQNVNVDGLAAGAPTSAPAVPGQARPAKKAFGIKVWAIIAGGVAFFAGVVKILEYLHVTPW